MNNKDINKICKLIRSSKKTYVLTGAGISTESGIPDFRSPGTGLWEKINPFQALTASVLINEPREFYNIGYKLLLSMKDYEPNRAHFVLAEMERLGFIEGIITQNIGNLPHKAGSKNIFEVHGNTRTGKCVDCANEIDLSVITNKVKNEQIPPICDICEGVLRPNVVLFEDQLPLEFDIAYKKVKESDLLIVVGSSLSVAPVSILPQLSDYVVIINIGQTYFDQYADILIHETASIVLTKILEILKSED